MRSTPSLQSAATRSTWGCPLERERHLGHGVLDLGVVRHGGRQPGDRGLLPGRRVGQVARPPGEPEVDVGEGRLGPAEDRRDEEIGAGEVGAEDPGDALVRQGSRHRRRTAHARSAGRERPPAHPIVTSEQTM
jgi:hypothetical protein